MQEGPLQVEPSPRMLELQSCFCRGSVAYLEDVPESEFRAPVLLKSTHTDFTLRKQTKNGAVSVLVSLAGGLMATPVCGQGEWSSCGSHAHLTGHVWVEDLRGEEP